MVKSYQKKKIEIIYKHATVSPEAIQKKLDATFDLLFDELFKDGDEIQNSTFNTKK